MTELAAISRERHAKKAWKDVTDYAFASGDSVIPLLGVELSNVVPAMPMGFIEQEGRYQLVAITSLQPGANLYVAPDGKWLVPYIPAGLRAYPFKLAQHKNTEKLTLCINEASGLLVDKTEGGNAFFDDEGEPTEKIKEILEFLAEIEASRTATQRAVDALADAGLVTPWALNLRQGENIVPVEGLFQIDEVTLNNLDDADFLILRESGSLSVAYAQMLSMHQLVVLERLGEMQDQILAHMEENSEAVSLTGFSLAEDEGSLIFE